jgi:hypothetical protein
MGRCKTLQLCHNVLKVGKPGESGDSPDLNIGRRDISVFGLVHFSPSLQVILPTNTNYCYIILPSYHVIINMILENQVVISLWLTRTKSMLTDAWLIFINLDHYRF